LEEGKECGIICLQGAFLFALYQPLPAAGYADPGGGKPANLNRFGYVLDNPIRFNDPTGHVCTDPEHPNPTCYGSPLTQTKVGNRMIRGNGAELRNLSIYKPKPPQRTFHTSFQMFPALPNSTGVETYTDFSTGGNPEYTPMLPYAPDNPTIRSTTNPRRLIKPQISFNYSTKLE
jgi:hypothetical protein